MKRQYGTRYAADLLKYAFQQPFGLLIAEIANKRVELQNTRKIIRSRDDVFCAHIRVPYQLLQGLD